MEIVVPSGLDGVIVTETAISDIDGEQGRLSYRGHAIEEVVAEFRWDDVVRFLVEPERLSGHAPAHEDAPMALLVDTLLAEAEGRDLADGEVLLQYVLDVPERFARRLGPGYAGKLPDELLRAGRYLAELRGELPSALHAAALDAYWVMAAEHSLNASTFAVRIAASTGARLPLALAAGVAVLSGPLHGGAPTDVLDLLEEAASYPGTPAALIQARLDAGIRIPGFGHRVYRTEDPRARALRGRFLELSEADARAARARELETAALAALGKRHPERVLATNVEFYAAVVLDALGIPRNWCPPTFAAGRLAGWTAHYVEQRAEGRLIRPLARYRPRSAAASG